MCTEYFYNMTESGLSIGEMSALCVFVKNGA